MTHKELTMTGYSNYDIFMNYCENCMNAYDDYDNFDDAEFENYTIFDDLARIKAELNKPSTYKHPNYYNRLKKEYNDLNARCETALKVNKGSHLRNDSISDSRDRGYGN